MKILKMISTWFIESGVTKETPASDIKYVRFLNATLLLLFTAQIPMLGLMIGLASWVPLLLNLAATGVCWLGFMLNRRGNHLTAKMLVLTIMIANSTHPAFVMGSTAPAHLWLIPAAVLGVLVFKPSERFHMAAFVGITLVVFTYLEFVYRDLEPLVRQMETAGDPGWPTSRPSAPFSSRLFSLDSCIGASRTRKRRCHWRRRNRSVFFGQFFPKQSPRNSATRARRKPSGMTTYPSSSQTSLDLRRWPRRCLQKMLSPSWPPSSNVSTRSSQTAALRR